MSQVIPLSPDNVVAYIIEESLTGSERRDLKETVSEKALRNPRLRLYVEVRPRENSQPTAGLLQDVVAALETETECFDRVAVATFSSVRDVSPEQLDNLIPEASVSAFELRADDNVAEQKERARAVAWLLAN